MTDGDVVPPAKSNLCFITSFKFSGTPYCMSDPTKYSLLTFLIATVWIVNGLFCKVLNLVPRHQQIVGAILGDTHSRVLTLLIGVAEIMIAVWILSGIKTRLNSIAQVLIIASMNLLEFALVPNLLLWGRANSVFAFLFILLICHNEFQLKKKLIQET